MIEDIQIMLERVGVLLTFSSFSIYGIPKYLIETLYNGAYKSESQEFSFIISTLDARDNLIAKGQNFSFSDTSYSYTFTITNEPVFDLTGYTTLICSYISKVAI